MVKKNEPNPRNEYIRATSAGEVSEIELSFDTETGALSFGTNFVNAHSVVSYDRKKGEKILSRVPQSNDVIFQNQSTALEKHFDFICAVDTNTQVIQGSSVSVVGIVTLQSAWVPESRGLTKYWQYNTPFCLEFIRLRPKPENVGWFAALEELKKAELIGTAERIGIIVDSDLGNIPDFNTRKAPVFDQIYLPKGIQLIYASADSGKENVANQMIGFADKASSMCLDYIRDGRAPFNAKRIDHPNYDGFRILTPNSVNTV